MRQWCIWCSPFPLWLGRSVCNKKIWLPVLVKQALRIICKVTLFTAKTLMRKKHIHMVVFKIQNRQLRQKTWIAIPASPSWTILNWKTEMILAYTTGLLICASPCVYLFEHILSLHFSINFATSQPECCNLLRFKKHPGALAKTSLGLYSVPFHAMVANEVRRSLQVIDQLIEEKVGGQELSRPSVSFGATNLYMRGPLEEDTRANLPKVCFSFFWGLPSTQDSFIERNISGQVQSFIMWLCLKSTIHSLSELPWE